MARSFGRPYKTRRFLTEHEETEALRLYIALEWSVRAVARHLGVSHTPVKRVLISAGVCIKKKFSRFTTSEQANITTAYVGGQSSTYLASSHKTTAHVVLKIVRDAGGSVRSQKERVFTPVELESIVARYKSGETANAIAASYGVFHRRILKIVRQAGIKRRPINQVKFVDAAGRSFTLRSGWEVLVARFFDERGMRWDYELRRFDVVVDGKKRTYKPDFWIYGAANEIVAIIDVKGRGCARQRRSIAAFVEQYPDLPFEIWSASTLRELGLLSPFARSVSHCG